MRKGKAKPIVQRKSAACRTIVREVGQGDAPGMVMDCRNKTIPSEIEITINGESHSVAQPCSIHDLLALLIVEGRLAVDVNGEIVPRSEHKTYNLSAGDRVEIVHAIGGG